MVEEPIQQEVQRLEKTALEDGSGERNKWSWIFWEWFKLQALSFLSIQLQPDSFM